MSNKEKFYRLTKDYFEAGIIREIYQSDKISVCNLCNTTYAVFNYSFEEEIMQKYKYNK